MTLGEWLPVSLHLSHPRVNTHSRPLYPAWLHALPRVLWNKPVSNNLYFPRQPKTFLHFLTFHSFTQQTLFSPRKFPKTLEERMRDTHGLQNTVGRRSHCHYLGKQHREPGRAWRRPGKAESRPKEEGQTHQPPPVLSLRKSGCRKRGWGEHPLPQPSCSDRPPLPGPASPSCSENPGSYFWYKPDRTESRWVWPLSSQGGVLPCSTEQTPRMNP